MRFLRSLLLLVLLCSSCKTLTEESPPGDTPPHDPETTLDVLFIGNSLTYTHDLPQVVATLAEVTGVQPIRVGAVTGGNMSLEDHWRAGQARVALENDTWDFVVMQQGPSSLPQNQEHLQHWARTYAEVARTHGTEPALYMVWPAASFASSFDAVVHSYTAASDSAEARLLPAGRAWQVAWERNPNLALYGPDNFHPSQLGTLLAALTIYGGLYGELPQTLPSSLDVGNGEPLHLSSSTRTVLKAAAQQALDAEADRQRRRE